MARVSKKYKYAVIASDIVIFTIIDNKLQALLIKMKKKPFTGQWAVPGGLVKPSESVDSAAKRLLKEKTGISNVYLEQLYTFGKVDRDPFGRVVSVSYFALIPNTGLHLRTTKEYEDVEWFPINKLPKIAYDHKEVIECAVDRLKNKLGYTNIVYSLLPKEFTLGELQKIYEIILQQKIDKRNFRKKINSLKIVRATGKKREGEANRPAELFTFTSRQLKRVEIL